MLLGVAFYSIIIGILSSVISHMNIKDITLKRKLHIVNDFCVEMKVCNSLKKKISDSLKYNFDKNCFEWLN